MTGTQLRDLGLARIVRIWAHSVPILGYAPTHKDEKEAYYFRPGVRVGSYRVKY